MLKNPNVSNFTDNKKPQKLSYVSPKFHVFGSVRELTMHNGGSATDGNTMGNPGNMGSDRCLKKDIIRIGDHPIGVGLYLFDYKSEYSDTWGHGRQFGVMADEVEAVLPEAISIHADGYKVVNYAMLGISSSLN